MYPNLRAEMARYSIKTKDIAEILEVTPKTIRDKLNGKHDFTNSEMRKVRDKFFSVMTIDTLFLSETIS